MRNHHYDVKVCIVGLGPAGLGAAHTLSYTDLASSTLCLEAGKNPTDRYCSALQNNSCKKCDPCEIIGGFGGCSLVGGGKISVFPAGSKLIGILGSSMGERITSKAISFFDSHLHLLKQKIMSNEIETANELFKSLGFVYRYYDAYIYDTGELQVVYQKFLSKLKDRGMTILLNTKLIEVNCGGNGFRVLAKCGEESHTILTKYLVLGMGRLGRNTLRSLNNTLNLGGKENHIDAGIRLEFPTDFCPDITKYHNDLKLLFGDARTFCVCKDGRVIPYLLENALFTEGCYDLKHKSGFTNLGIIVRLNPSKQNERIFDEIKKRAQLIGNRKPICQTLSDYLGVNAKNHASLIRINSSISFWEKGDVNQCFPEPISTKIKEATHYFVSKLLPSNHWDEINVFAPEVDYGGLSFPITSDFSIIPRMYLIGDCTGRFRGILQAFSSGIISGESIIGDENEKKS